MLAMSTVTVLARQAAQEQTPPPKPRPRPVTFAERMKQYLARSGATVDESKSAPDMIVSNSADAKGGKITVVLVNDRRRNLLGFYIYNFGSVKNAANKEEVYKYLLEANDAITIGSFFVDPDEDIGYKYLVNGAQTISQAAFESTYFTMTSVARERKPAIKRLLTGGGKEEKPEDAKTATQRKDLGESDIVRGNVVSGVDQEAALQRDYGVDVAIVNATMANLREEPNASSQVTLKLQRGAVLALVDRSPVGPWYNVIDVESSKEGWIHGNVIKVFYTTRQNSAPVFQAEKLANFGEPLVEINNDSDEQLNLRLGRQLHTIPVQTKKTIRLAPGAYKFYGSAPGVIPTFGTQNFEAGYRYTWRFWITTTIR